MVGHKIRNLSTIDRRFICSLCISVLKSPFQLSQCGHHLCQSCFIDEDQKLTIVCQTCGEKTSRENVKFDQGLVDDMQTILIECSFCDWSGIFRDYQKHLDENHFNVICEFCQKRFSSVDDLTRHEFKECSSIIIECPLPQIGCREKFRRSDLHQHFLSPPHQFFLSNFIRKIFENRQNYFNEIRQILHGLEHLAGGIQLMNEDLQRLERENISHRNALNAAQQNIFPLSKSIEEKQFTIETSKATHEIIEKDLRVAQRTIDEFALMPFDGTFIWKIENIRQKIAEAQTNFQTSFYSPPFYSSRNGYKMRLRLYPTGDGNARGTHLSLFFVLMRSEFDGILKYPFCFKVIFCLWDQSGRNEHIIDSFRPDPRSNSFQRPRSEMNIASGLPKFVPLNVLLSDDNRFIRDETIFIKVLIDFANFSQRQLEQIFQLDPSIPRQIEFIQRQSEDNNPQT